MINNGAFNEMNDMSQELLPAEQADILKPTEDGLPNIHLRLEQFDSAVRAAIETIKPTDEYDNALRLLDWITIVKAMTADWKKLIKLRVIEAMRAHGTDSKPDEIQVGDVRYYEGATKRVTPNDIPAILEAILNATGGDVAAMAECLSSSPFKQATVRDTIGEYQHADLFTTDYVPDLKTGKPKRDLQIVNEKFTPRRAPEAR